MEWWCWGYHSQGQTGIIWCASSSVGQRDSWTEPEQLWKVEEGTVEVPMKLGKVEDASTEGWRVGTGGVWPVEASCILVDGEERSGGCWMSCQQSSMSKL